MGAVVKLLDFSKDIPTKDHPDLNTTDTYVIMREGEYFAVTLSSVWFGYNMYGRGINGQLDVPGTNGCRIQHMWKVIDSAGLRSGESILESSGIDTVTFSKDSELKFAIDCKNYAISHGLVSNGRKITEESPIEAWMYNSDIPKMERLEIDDDDDDSDWS